MYRHDRRSRVLAGLLAALAGMIDGIGFLGSGGYFVSFMSGNSTRLGVGLAERLAAAWPAALLIGSFVLGVVLCTLAKRRIALFARPQSILACVATGISLAAMMGMWLDGLAPFVLLAMAMGALNLVFEESGDIRIGLTYMTGTLVKLGSHFADGLLGSHHNRWPPFLWQWLALTSGAAVGAALFAGMGTHALWIAALAAWMAAMLAGRVLSAKPA
ncbi:YoaK family protein [Croceicoccus sp. Ery5]|uniref:YoaK family protein n=1 Tax=Croceicoccus sp. Ery5 TaxID=1703340 RepID=UPI001E611833|nr:YoaK family protein [Croceicoccus sp. Ery5]